MKRTTLYVLTALGLLAFGFAPTLVKAQDPPSVQVQPNSPGWITVAWEHVGEDTDHYVVERKDPDLKKRYLANVNFDIFKDHKASTTYSYRVCAVDSNNEENCSPWISVTTPPAEGSSSYSAPVFGDHYIAPDRIRISWSSTTRYGSFNVRWAEKGSRHGQENVRGNGTSGSFEVRGLVPGRTFEFLVQGCNWGLLGSGCSSWSGVELSTPLPPPPHPTAPAVTASASGATHIVLSWPLIEAERIVRTVIERDGGKHVAHSGVLSRYDDSVRANTQYAYRVCLTNQTGTACSGVITAMGQPVVPSALADVTFTQTRSSGAAGGRLSRNSARMRTRLRATWRNVGTPGEFITLERQDRGPTDPIRVGTFWTEVNRISAKTDPTEIEASIRPPGPQIGIREGNIYRICSLVPALGRAGKVCSRPSALTAQ